MSGKRSISTVCWTCFELLNKNQKTAAGYLRTRLLFCFYDTFDNVRRYTISHTKVAVSETVISSGSKSIDFAFIMGSDRQSSSMS